MPGSSHHSSVMSLRQQSEPDNDDMISQSSLTVPSNLDAVSVSQVSISQASIAAPKMIFNQGNQILATSFGKKTLANETVSGFGAVGGNDESIAVSKANETKMSDNEAFMAYMSRNEEDEY